MNIFHQVTFLYLPNPLIQKEIEVTMDSDYSTLSQNKNLQNNHTNKIQIEPEIKLDLQTAEEIEVEKEEAEKTQIINNQKINDVNQKSAKKMKNIIYLEKLR